MATSINLYPAGWHRIEGETVAVPESEMDVVATWVGDDGAPHQGACTVRLSHILTHMDTDAQNEVSRDLLMMIAQHVLGVEA
jgi:hypothetical protein